MLLRPRSEDARAFGRARRRVQPRVRARDRRLRRRQPPPRPQARDPARRSSRASPAAAGSLGRKLPSGFVPDEDQGYAIIGVQLPDGASLQRTRGRLRRRSTPSSPSSRASARTTASPASASSRARPRATPAPASSAFTPWDERKRPTCPSDAILGSLNAAFSRIPEARVFAVAPPAIPGISAAGGFSMMLQDKSGGTYDFLAQNVGQVRRRGAQAPRARGRAAELLAGRSAALRRRRQGQGAQGRRRRSREIYNALQTFLGGSYINDFTRFGRQWRVFLQAEPSFRTRPDDIGQFYVRNAQRRHGAALVVRPRPADDGPRVHGALQPVPLRRDPWAARRPATAPGQALDALEDVAAKTLPPEMGYAWNGALVPGEGGVRRTRRGCSGSRSSSSS